jgi:perosamine synthetase
MDTNSNLSQDIVRAIKSVVGDGPIALHEPSFKGNEWIYLKECLDSTFVSSVGKFVDRFEEDLANFTGAKRAVAVVNGTAALHIALHLAGVQAGDEVLLPALTFIATANAVAYCQAKPHFVDSEERSLGMDAVALREYLSNIAEIRNGQCVNRSTGRVIRAIVPMHTFGHPVDINALLAIAHDFPLAIDRRRRRIPGQHHWRTAHWYFWDDGYLEFQWQQDHHHWRRRRHFDQ